jgi:cyclopropane fatty-acyl-phospholipid synthase-like methyltransferase
MKTKDLFADKSKNWDAKSRRVQGAKAIADAIKADIALNQEMHLMDFGAGTGLLGFFLSKEAGKITAVDNSPSMLQVFQEKADSFGCPTEVLQLDFTQQLPKELHFDGIVSSMTIHHIKDTKAMLTKMYQLLPSNGFIALADLDTEDGSFHSDNEGVFHFGFKREALGALAKEVGFREVKFMSANLISKPHRDFSVFLMVGWR